MSTAYHPQTDGQTERANRTSRRCCVSYVNLRQNDWDEHLPALELAINNSRHASTGSTPFYLNYGQEVSLPLDHAVRAARDSPNPEAADRIRRLHESIALAKEHLLRAQQRQGHYADQHRRHITFNSWGSGSPLH